MRSINFYHQKRQDGAFRTGVDSDGVPLLERFEIGGEEWDSALAWFIDVRLSGSGLPTGSPDQVRDWLRSVAPAIQMGMRDVAAELPAGIDKDWPVVRKIDLGIANLSAEVAVACVRRVDGPEFASRLRETADSFVELLDSLLPLADVSR